METIQTSLFVTHQICQGNTSNFFWAAIKIFRTPTKYLQDTHQKSPGHPQNISRTPIKYLQDTQPISPGDPTNISRKPKKYLQETQQISPANPSNISRTPI